MSTRRPRNLILCAAVVFLGGTLLGTRPAPRPTTLGRIAQWTVSRTVRRTRFTAVARGLTTSLASADPGIQPAPTRRPRLAAASSQSTDLRPGSPDLRRQDGPESKVRPVGSTPLRC